MPATRNNWLHPQTGELLLAKGEWMGTREVEVLGKLGAVREKDLGGEEMLKWAVSHSKD